MTEQQKFGNTDPMLIAKYDDELRKVQGGWVDAVVYEARFLVDRLKEYEADGCQCDESVRQWNGHVSAPLARLEMALSDAAAPTEHPTEQPVYETCSKCSGSGQIIGDAGEPTLCSECNGDTVVASEQPSVRDALISIKRLISYPVSTEISPTGYGLRGETKELIQAVYNTADAALRSLAQEGE